MPIFEFSHEESGETISLHLDLKQPSEAYRLQTIDGKTYKRVYTAPLAGRDTIVRDATLDDYTRITENKNLTVGEMAKISKEMAEKRGEREGTDKVKNEFYRNYEQKIGKKHKDEIKNERRKKAEASLKKFGVSVDMSK